MTYKLNTEGLADAVAAAPYSRVHLRLMKTLQGLSGLQNLRLSGARDSGGYLVARKVLDTEGRVVSEDHETWLRVQVAADGGSLAATRARLRPLGYQLSKCEVSDVYLVQDTGSAPEDFLQLRIQVEDERLDCPLFGEHSYLRDNNLLDFRDLLDDLGTSQAYPSEKRTHIRPVAYVLRESFDFAAFVREKDALDASDRARQRQMRFTMSTNGGTNEIVGYDQLDPDWEKWPQKVRRWLNDWSMSSAGRSGAKLSDSWVAQITDGLDHTGQRHMGYIPAWTHTAKIAKIDSRKGSVYELFGKLQKLDQRMGVPFAWYFYMLHGNLVDDTAGHRVLAGAEQGLLVLPEHDYQVLRAWSQRSYGF